MSNEQTTPPPADPYDTPEYQAFLAEMAADEQRAAQRRGHTPPLTWGTDLGEGRYFCVPCWRAGHADGSHPYAVPPCDSAPRGAYDPR